VRTRSGLCQNSFGSQSSVKKRYGMRPITSCVKSTDSAMLKSTARLEKRLYLETVERVLPRVRRYVLEPGNEHSIPIRLVE
jgi:hypothetical protein